MNIFNNIFRNKNKIFFLNLENDNEDDDDLADEKKIKNNIPQITVNYHNTIYKMTELRLLMNNSSYDNEVIALIMRDKYINHIKEIYNRYKNIIFIKQILWYEYSEGIQKKSPYIHYCSMCKLTCLCDKANESDCLLSCGHQYCLLCFYNMCNKYGYFRNLFGKYCNICKKHIKYVYLIGYNFTF